MVKKQTRSHFLFYYLFILFFFYYIFIFSSSRSLRGLHKCGFLSTDVAECRLHRCLPEFEQGSDSRI